MQRLLIALLAAAFLVTSFTLVALPGTAEEDIFTTVTTEKTVYSSSEPIDITVTVTNRGPGAVTLTFPSSLQLYYGVSEVGTDELIFDRSQNITVYLWLTHIVLDPGGSESYTYDGPGEYGSWNQVNDDGTHVEVPGYYVICGLLDDFLIWEEYEVGWKVILISDDLQSPKAALTAPSSSAFVGEELNFDASSSTDAAGGTDLLEYRWDWDGNTVFDTDWSGDSIARHAFLEEGTYTVMVEVRDPAGLVDEASTDVHIEADIPEFPSAAPLALACALAALIVIKRRR